MYRIGSVALCLAVLVGCDFDGLNNLITPVVGQGMVLGIEIPEIQGVDMSSMPFDKGTAMTMFLANANSPGDMENAPIRNADVTVKTIEGADPVVAQNAGDGMYAILPDGTENPATAYVEGAKWTFTANVPEHEDPMKINVTLPQPGNPTVPTQVDVNVEQVIPFTQGNFTTAIVMVSDAMSGELTYSNKPETIKEVFDMTRANDPITGVTIPGEAFPNPDTLYLVGIAPMTHTTGEDVTGMNTLLSTGMAGVMQLFPTTTFVLDTDAL